MTWALPKNKDEEIIFIHANDQLMMESTLYEIEHLPPHENDLGAISFKLHRPIEEGVRGDSPQINAGGIFKQGLLYLHIRHLWDSLNLPL